MAKNNKKENGMPRNEWPKKTKLKEAIDVFEDFHAMCQFQMDLGYWATVDFPTKHHINKILSIQYMDRDTLDRVYGEGLVEKVFKMIPLCKHYVGFVKDMKEGNDEPKQSNSSSAKASGQK